MRLVGIGFLFFALICPAIQADELGSITIKIELLPEGNNFPVEFSPGAGIPDEIRRILEGEISVGESLTADVPAGQYFLRQMGMGDGWNIIRIDCDDDNSSQAGYQFEYSVYFRVAPGEHVTCTFINGKQGSLTVINKAIPSSDRLFNFSLHYGHEWEDWEVEQYWFAEHRDALLQDNGDSFDDYTDRITWVLRAGRYFTLKEIWEQESDYSLYDLWCVESVDSTGSPLIHLEERKVNADVNPGEDIICTYTHRHSSINSDDCQLSVVSPSGGEAWAPGETRVVTWQSSGTACGDTVELVLLRPGQDQSVISARTSNDGKKAWTIPEDQAFGNDYRVEIRGYTNGIVSSDANSEFTITSPGVANCLYELDLPNGGEEWEIGENARVRWNRSGEHCSDLAELRLYKAGVQVETDAVFHAKHLVPNTGEFQFEVPEVTEGSDYRLRILDSRNYQLFDQSNGGEQWHYGETRVISWKSEGEACGQYVDIELTHSNPFYYKHLFRRTPNDGLKAWKITEEYDPSFEYGMYIGTLGDEDLADGQFSIGPQEVGECEYTVLSPRPGVQWRSGETRVIQWNAEGAGCFYHVKWEVIRDGQVLWEDSPVFNDGLKAWRIPSGFETGDDFRVKVSDLRSSQFFAWSDFFSVLPEEAAAISHSPEAGGTPVEAELADQTVPVNANRIWAVWLLILLILVSTRLKYLRAE
jgi:hypothetical protein